MDETVLNSQQIFLGIFKKSFARSKKTFENFENYLTNTKLNILYFASTWKIN